MIYYLELSYENPPLSSGDLRLVNTNAEENPSVKFNYISHPYDLSRCVAGIRLATQVVQSKYFTEFTQVDRQTTEKLLNTSVQANVNLIPKHVNDTESLEQFCRDTVIMIWHYHGGCHVGKVVDSENRVIGRVVDVSTFSESAGTNPQATVMMIGRYMGVTILRERSGRDAGIKKDRIRSDKKDPQQRLIKL